MQHQYFNENLDLRVKISVKTRLTAANVDFFLYLCSQNSKNNQYLEQ